MNKKDELHQALFDCWLYETCMGVPFAEWLESHAIKQAAEIARLTALVTEQAAQIKFLTPDDEPKMEAD